LSAIGTFRAGFPKTSVLPVNRPERSIMTRTPAGEPSGHPVRYASGDNLLGEGPTIWKFFSLRLRRHHNARRWRSDRSEIIRRGAIGWCDALRKKSPAM